MFELLLNLTVHVRAVAVVLCRCTHGFADTHLIGQGSVACVYRAVDPVGGLRFAVKRLRPEALASPRSRTSAHRGMQRELELLTSLKHPHIIRLLGYALPDIESSDTCLVYELGIHGSVAQTIADDDRAKGFGWKARTRAIVSLASALNFLHRSHKPPMFHRDVKGDNVVLCAGMVAKLIDVGIAGLLTPEQQVRLSLCTVGGMPYLCVGVHAHLRLCMQWTCCPLQLRGRTGCPVSTSTHMIVNMRAGYNLLLLIGILGCAAGSARRTCCKDNVYAGRRWHDWGHIWDHGVHV